jgi:hypothetical protein
MGILSPTIFTALMPMALVTTIMTGPLLTLFSRETAKDMALAGAEAVIAHPFRESRLTCLTRARGCIAAVAYRAARHDDARNSRPPPAFIRAPSICLGDQT